MPLLARWGTGESAPMAAPVITGRDPDFKAWWGRWERLSASPGTVLKREELFSQLDVREILPRVQAPTLVLHRPRAARMNPKHAEYFTERIPNAKLVRLPGGDAISFGDGVEAWLEAVEEFTQGTIAPRGAERALATVLFTDIVGSTPARGRARRPALAADPRAARSAHPRARRRLRRPGDQVDRRRLPRHLRRPRARGPLRDDAGFTSG